MADKPETKIDSDAGILDDIARLGTTVGQIVRFWTIPMNNAPIEKLENGEKETFRITALAVIVFLFLLLRPDIEHGTVSFLFGIAVAAFFAFLSNALLAYNIRISDKVVIGSYAFLAATLTIYLLLRAVFSEVFLAELPMVSAKNICNYFEGKLDASNSCETFISVRTAYLTFIVSVFVLAVKSVIIDGNFYSEKNIKSSINVSNLATKMVYGVLVIILFVIAAFMLDIVPTGVLNLIKNSITGGTPVV